MASASDKREVLREAAQEALKRSVEIERVFGGPTPHSHKLSELGREMDRGVHDIADDE